MQITTRDFIRSALQKFIPDHRTIVELENMQSDVMNTGVALSTAEFVTLVADDNLGSERVLTPTSDISLVDGGAGNPVTLGLTNTAVTPNPYGSASKTVSFTVSAKGRLTLAAEYALNFSNIAGTVSVAQGGTNIASYAVGDLIFASGATTLSKLADVATGNVLLSGGVTTAPLWGKVGLTTHVTGVLPAANGGFPAGGFSGTVTPVTSITVVNGLVTAVS